MNKTAIKNFAIWARVNLIESAKQKAFEYEVTEDGQNNSSLDIIAGPLSSTFSPVEVVQEKRMADSSIIGKAYLLYTYKRPIVMANI